MSQVDVNKIFQDSEGYMWFWTSNGLNKYNGNEFKVYKYHQNENYKLSNNTITDIEEDKNKNIWVGTFSGLNKINLHTNEITTYLSNENSCNLSNNKINDIFTDSKGNVLISTDDGVNLYNKNKNNFERLFFEESSTNNLDSQKINCIIEDSYDNYWVATDKGLNKINISTNQITSYSFESTINGELKSHPIKTLSFYDSNVILVGSSYGSLFKINIATDKIDKFPLRKDVLEVPGLEINHITKGSNKLIWLATNLGLLKYDEKNDSFSFYKNKPYDSNTISSNNIHSLYEDNYGFLWIGTSKGINILNPYSPFKQYRNDILNENSLSSNIITGIYEDNDNLLWVGTIDSGLNIIDRKNDKITRINTSNTLSKISSDIIREITGIDNEIWLATGSGLIKIDKSNMSITNYGLHNGLTDTDIRALFIDNNGTLWIGTKSKILSFDRNSNFTDYTDFFNKNGVSIDRIRDINQDSDGLLWIVTGGKSGLIKFDVKANTFKVYNDFSSNYTGKGDDSIWSVTPDDDKYIWIATNYGIIRLNKETGNYRRFTELNGLSSNTTLGIVIDNDHNLWISTYDGLNKLDARKTLLLNLMLVMAYLEMNLINTHFIKVKIMNYSLVVSMV